MQNEAKEKSRIMQRILLNDAEIRHLAEPWLEGSRPHDGRPPRVAALIMFEDTRPASLDALGSGDGLAEFALPRPGRSARCSSS